MLQACSQNLSNEQLLIVTVSVLIGALHWGNVEGQVTSSCNDLSVLAQASYTGPAVPIPESSSEVGQTSVVMPRFPDDLSTSSRALVVTVNVTHEFVGDVRLVLVAPNSQSWVLKAGYANTYPPYTDGGSGTSMFNTRFYIDSCPDAARPMTGLNSSQAPYSAGYKMFSGPRIGSVAMSALAGRWVMLATDTFPTSSSGTLHSWNVKIVGYIEGEGPG
jgi:subtilisin-like proprotein convertase family protein